MIADATLVDDSVLLECYATTRDAQAFRELVNRYSRLVYTTCLRVTQNPQDAEDVSQECFLELARRASTIKSSLGGWLHKVAKTRSINEIRRDSSRRAREQQVCLDESTGAEPAWAEISPYVDEAVDALPDDLRIPLILHYFHGLTQSQVAQQIGISQPTVSRQLEKSVCRLRDELGKAGVVASTAVLAVLLTQTPSTAAPATLAAALGKMAVSGVGGTAASDAAGLAGHTLVKQVLGTVSGKIAAGAAAVGIVIGAAYVANTLAVAGVKGRDGESHVTPSAPTTSAMPVRPVPLPVATHPTHQQPTVQPMEASRPDPFAPANYVPPGHQPHFTPPISVPMVRLAPVSMAGAAVAAPTPEPRQPIRRMAGLIDRGAISAIIESNGRQEVVQPGDMLNDKLAVVESIMPDKVVLRTVGKNPRELVLNLAPSPVAGIPPPTYGTGQLPAGIPIAGSPVTRPPVRPMVVPMAEGGLMR